MRQVRVSGGLAVLTLWMLYAPVATAGPIIITDASRSVRGITTTLASETVSTTSTSGLFVAQVDDIGATYNYVATQDTVLSASLMGGSGSATTGITGTARSFAESRLFTQFVLDESYTVLISGDLFTSGSGFTGYPVAQVRLRSIASGTDLYFATATTSPVDVLYQGVLGPGTYSFFLSAASQQFNGGPLAGSANFDVDLTLAAVNAASVPEPASVTLLCTGLAGLAAKRWRRRRARH